MEFHLSNNTTQRAQRNSNSSKTSMKYKKWRQHCVKSTHEQHFYGQPNPKSHSHMIQTLKKLGTLDSLHLNILTGSQNVNQKAIDQVLSNICNIKILKTLNITLNNHALGSSYETSEKSALFHGLSKLNHLTELKIKLTEETNVNLLGDLSSSVLRLSKLRSLKLEVDYNQTQDLFVSLTRALEPLSQLKKLKLLVSYFSESQDDYESQQLWNLLQSNTKLENVSVGLFPKYFQDSPLAESFSSFKQNPNLKKISIQSSKWYEDDFTQLSSLFSYLEENNVPLSGLKLMINTHYISDMSVFHQAIESIANLSNLKNLALSIDSQLPLADFSKISEMILSILERLESLNLVLYLPNNARDNYAIFSSLMESIGMSNLKEFKLKVDYYKVCNEESILNLFKAYVGKFIAMKTFECTLKGARCITSEEIMNYLRKSIKKEEVKSKVSR